MNRFFLDSNVLVFAYGGAHPWRDSCRALVRSAAEGSVQLHASAEAVQEFVFHRMRRATPEEAVAEGHDVLQACVVHPLDQAILQRALTLMATTDLRGRDAVHAATALEHGFDSILTGDRDFAIVPGLRAISPADLQIG